MKIKVKAALVTLLNLSFILGNSAGLCKGHGLQVGFYRGKCGLADVEALVAAVITTRFLRDPSIIGPLLRLQFHDCFVNGCDASILLDGFNSEKTAAPNLNLRGYDIVDEAKDAVERVCPGTVSCADLIAIAARDVVFLSGGGRYEVQTGRRDGLISQARNVFIPSPSMPVSQAVTLFANKGLTQTDMVLLLGAHSVGIAHCSSFKDRLYNYKSTGKPDTTMDPFLADMLRFNCPAQNTTVDNIVKLDQNPFPFMDTSYYKELLYGRGILQIDQQIALDPLTRSTVVALTQDFNFPIRFGAAMVKLGTVQVLTGNQGEIRRSCRATNRPVST